MRQSLWFMGVREVALRDEPLPPVGVGEIGISAEYSAISAGTELLLYRGQMPSDMAADTSIASLSGSLAYPLKYGYSMVGRVTTVGDGVASAWLNRSVFAFHPHESHFSADVGSVIALPPNSDPVAATLLPNVETAVSFVMDGAPVIGERVLVIGQGVVGLLTAQLLARMPLDTLGTVDVREARRRFSAEIIPASTALAPEDVEADSYDLVYELSGNPQALDTAIAAVGFGGRILVGSWYGTKRAAIDLGGAFHRKHVQIISSQVSTLGPRWQARWTKQRRMAVALRALGQLNAARLITHQLGFADAAQAYALLDAGDDAVCQVVLRY